MQVISGYLFLVFLSFYSPPGLSPDSALAFKKGMKLAQFAERNPEAAEEMERKQKEAADAIPVGSRCEVTVAKAAPKRGTVMFVGGYPYFPFIPTIIPPSLPPSPFLFFLLLYPPTLSPSLTAGKTTFKPGYWVGVKYDEPVGKNDGRYIHRGPACVCRFIDNIQYYYIAHTVYGCCSSSAVLKE